MQFSLFFPTNEALDALIEKQRTSALTYPPNADQRPDFINDNNRILLGEGDAVFEAARKAMQSWAMFIGGWARIYTQNPQYTEGDIVILCARVFGLWWFNASRILTVFDTPDSAGFTYGTLSNHVESGEERFCVVRDAEGKVWYELVAFSKPRHFLVRLTFPLVRIFQKKFVRESLQNVKNETIRLLNTPQ